MSDPMEVQLAASQAEARALREALGNLTGTKTQDDRDLLRFGVKALASTAPSDTTVGVSLAALDVLDTPPGSDAARHAREHAAKLQAEHDAKAGQP